MGTAKAHDERGYPVHDTRAGRGGGEATTRSGCYTTGAQRGAPRGPRGLQRQGATRRAERTCRTNRTDETKQRSTFNSQRTIAVRTASRRRVQLLLHLAFRGTARARRARLQVECGRLSVEAGPGLGEADEEVGVVGGEVGLFEGVEEDGADDEVGTGGVEAGAGGVTGGGEVLEAVEDGGGFFAFVELVEPVLVVDAGPLADAVAAGFFGGFLVFGGAGPDEGVGVAGFEVEVRDVAVGDLGEEPLANGDVCPAVVKFAVKLFADVGREGGEVAAGGADGWF